MVQGHKLSAVEEVERATTSGCIEDEERGWGVEDETADRTLFSVTAVKHGLHDERTLLPGTTSHQ